MQGFSRYPILGLLTVSLLLGGIGRVVPVQAADETIRLHSDEAADDCIKNTDCMRSLFLMATLGSDGSSGGPDDRLMKWTTPIRLASLASNQDTDELQAIMGDAVKRMHRLAALADVDFRPSKGGDDDVVNFILLVSSDFESDRDKVFSGVLTEIFNGRLDIYDKLAAGEPPICQGQIFANQGAVISGGLSLVESDIDVDAFNRCLHQVALKQLGLRHVLPINVDSVLSPNSQRTSWTSIDFLLLKMLADPAVDPGMGKAELWSLLPEIHQRALHPSS